MQEKIKYIEKKVDYWKKHQELDKANHQESLSSFISIMSILFSAMIGLFSIISNFISDITLRTIMLFIIVCGFAIYLVVFKNSFQKKINQHNFAFVIREAMLRVWYQKEGVDTDLLDSQFEKIKRECTRKRTNKDIENIAKRIMEE